VDFSLWWYLNNSFIFGKNATSPPQQSMCIDKLFRTNNKELQEYLHGKECDYFTAQRSKEGVNEEHEMGDGVKIAVIGIAFHCIADGFAFGASGYSKLLILKIS
jgi:zinc transporter ZupT